MPRACADQPFAYKLATSSSMVLGGSWVAYGVYLMGANITKQSVYTGEITFYAAVLLSVSCITVAAMAGSTTYLAARKRPIWRRAGAWSLAGLAVAGLIFSATRGLIAAAS